MTPPSTELPARLTVKGRSERPVMSEISFLSCFWDFLPWTTLISRVSTVGLALRTAATKALPWRTSVR